jgi:hypothetical protein
VVASGLLLSHRLLEGEVTGQQRFMGEMKRSQRRVGSRARQVARALDAMAAAGIGIGGSALAVGGGRRRTWAG